jgi:hypothetical protein
MIAAASLLLLPNAMDLFVVQEFLTATVIPPQINRGKK